MRHERAISACRINSASLTGEADCSYAASVNSMSFNWFKGITHSSCLSYENGSISATRDNLFLDLRLMPASCTNSVGVNFIERRSRCTFPIYLINFFSWILVSLKKFIFTTDKDFITVENSDNEIRSSINFSVEWLR